jgi:hypothetical protein
VSSSDRLNSATLDEVVQIALCEADFPTDLATSDSSLGPKPLKMAN